MRVCVTQPLYAVGFKFDEDQGCALPGERAVGFWRVCWDGVSVRGAVLYWNYCG